MTGICYVAAEQHRFSRPPSPPRGLPSPARRLTSEGNPAAAGTGDVGIFACGRDENRTGAFRLRATPFLTAQKGGKDAPGDHSIKVPRTPPHGQRGSAPYGIPYESLRGT